MSTLSIKVGLVTRHTEWGNNMYVEAGAIKQFFEQFLTKNNKQRKEYGGF
jgi:hypothetical protein